MATPVQADRTTDAVPAEPLALQVMKAAAPRLFTLSSTGLPGVSISVRELFA